MYHQLRKSQSTRARRRAVGESEPGPQHSGLAEQSRGTDGSSGTSTSVSSVMSLMTKEVVEWNEDPKQGKGEETFELPGDKKSGVNEAEAERENNKRGWTLGLE